jgi:SAM-dependent methyltransferase
MSTIDEFYTPQLYDAKVGDAAVDDSLVVYCLSKAGGHPRRVLDIGAGTGRLAIPLLRAGHKVICIDQSAAMLQALRENVVRECPAFLAALEISHRPFGGRGPEAPVELAFAIDDFLLHLTTEEQLAHFFEDLHGWFHPGARFFTDVRPRNTSDLLIQSHNPVDVRTFGLVGSDRASHGPHQYGMIFWEQYDPSSRRLTTTCQYQTIGKSGAVERTFYRVLHQRVHANSEIQSAAERGGFDLVGHNMQSRQGVSVDCDIGGNFEFRRRRADEYR